jgi:MerR family transcriptional regulator, light-induced transcriptional regulator
MSFSIRELEALSGIKAHTIRIWEQRYQFLKPSRTDTNIRTYNNDELKTLLTVALLNKYGYRISKIDEMLPQQREKALMDLNSEEAYDETMVNKLLGFMVDLKSAEFEQALDEYIAQKGLEETITGIIFQFLNKVGILWQTNKLLPVQEHVVSNIIRQKIIRAIDKLGFVTRQKPLYALFMPEGEHHELGLLYVYYLLRKNNIPVLYLGANVPLKDMQYLVQIKQPQFLYMHLTVYPRMHTLQKILSSLSSLAPQSNLLVSGIVTENYRQQLPHNVRFFKSLEEMVTYINQA